MTESLTGDDLEAAHDEFEDSAEDSTRGDLHLSDLDWRLLRSPVVARSLIGLAVALAIVIWPGRTDQILARLVGVGLLVLGANSLWGAIRGTGSGRRWLDLATAAGAMLVGVGLLAVPGTRSGTLLGRLLGLLLLASAIRMVYGVIVSRRNRDRSSEESVSWPLAQALMLTGLGGLLVLFPESMLNVTAALFAAGYAALALIAVGMSIDRSTEGVTSITDAQGLVVRWLEERPKDADDRQALYAKILYDGPTASRRIVRFFALMGFAAVIASTGVIGNSTAVVIGAMLIAPLMTPLMGMAVSLVMGWPNRLTRSAIIAGAGIAFAITIGFVIGLISPVAIDTTTNEQILARISPTTLDLMIAVAAGAAGAYGLSRPDVSDSLPGVAIAISLVPPLTVVGISWSQGDLSAGGGALLLFATNMLAILLVGGLTFVVTGVTPIRRLADNQHRTRTAIAAIGGIAAFVIGALLLNGAQAAQDLADQGGADETVAEWLEPYPDHSPVEVLLDGDRITAVVLGPSEGAPPAGELAQLLATRLDRSVTANVRLVVEERSSAEASP